MSVKKKRKENIVITILIYLGWLLVLIVVLSLILRCQVSQGC